MKFDKFKRYVINIDNFEPSEVDSFQLMSFNELFEYQTKLEQTSDDLSDWDHLRAIITLKHELWEKNSLIDELESEVRMWKSNCGEFDEDDEMEEE